MAVGVVLLIPVPDKVGLRDIAPAQAVLLCQRSALPEIALRAVLTGGEHAVPQLHSAAGVVVIGCNAVREQDIADAGMTVIADIPLRMNLYISA